MIRIKRARYVRDFTVEFTFTDGSRREIDLAPFLSGPIFESLRTLDAFKKFRLDRELGTIVWPNGADIDPDVLYLGLTPAASETPAR
ncbi:MAG TPA: DUF2442 domain-containing protein [Anaerolineae bacterium]|nr:DUF2442 domain-containing protein [Anaerolineae bacterium]